VTFKGGEVKEEEEKKKNSRVLGPRWDREKSKRGNLA